MTNPHEQPDWISRHLVRSREKAVLATVMRDTDGDPYASLVLTASDYFGNPMVYISDMAEHTKNLWENQRVSMLFERTSGLNDPLSGARVSLQGRMQESKDPALKERFFKRHEQSRKYENAHNFFLYHMTVERAHLVAGFGRIHWLNDAEYHFPADRVLELAEAENGIVTHMNEDHADAIDLIAQNLMGADGEGWAMIGIDPEGFDLRKRDRVIRYDFEHPLMRAEDSRPLMVDLVNQARSQAPAEAATA